MARITVTDLAGTLAELQAQIAELSKRMEALEKNGAAAAVAAPPKPAAVPQAAAPPAPETITEEELLAISAAIAAFMGVARTFVEFDCSAAMHGHNRGVCRFRRRIVCKVSRAVNPAAGRLSAGRAGRKPAAGRITVPTPGASNETEHQN